VAAEEGLVVVDRVMVEALEAALAALEVVLEVLEAEDQVEGAELAEAAALVEAVVVTAAVVAAEALRVTTTRAMGTIPDTTTPTTPARVVKAKEERTNDRT
jgi:hypothetical protein